MVPTDTRVGRKRACGFKGMHLVPSKFQNDPRTNVEFNAFNMRMIVDSRCL